MVKRGIDRICISVSDMEESLAFFRDHTGMSVCADLALSPEKMQKFWNLPEGTTARAVGLKKDGQPSVLELVEFRPNTGKNIRDAAAIFDYGIYDIAFIVKDLDTTYNDLLAKGFTFIAPPKTYTPPWFPVEVKEAILIGPGGIPVAHLEMVGSPMGALKEDYGMIGDSAQVVENIDKALRFYKDILGLDLIADEKLPRGLVDDVLALPPDTDLRMAFLNRKGCNNPVVEFLEFSTKGSYVSSAGGPPNCGIFMISFETDDLAALAEKLRKERIAFLSGPMRMEIPCFGKADTILVEAPGRVMVELFERHKQ